MASGTIPIFASGEDSGWQTLTDNAVFSGTIFYRKIGKCVEVQGVDIKLKSALNENTTLVLVSSSKGIPAGYRPHQHVYAFGGYGKSLCAFVKNDGTVSIRSIDAISTSDYIEFTTFYFQDR